VPVVLAVVGATLRFDNSKTRVAVVAIEHRMRLIEFTETGGEDEIPVAGNVLVAKNSTWYSSSAARISAMTDSSRGWGRSTPSIKAPRCGEYRSALMIC